MTDIQLTVRAGEGDPVKQVREALTSMRRQLAAQGVRREDIISMVWRAARPAQFHMARREIDLAYRAVLSGHKRPIELVPGEGPLVIEVAARRSPPLNDKDIVWRNLTATQLAQETMPRNTVSMADVHDKWSERSAAFRARQKDAVYDISYGKDDCEKFDIFYPRGVRKPPLWVFIHGGAHQAGDKHFISHFAAGMVEAGYACQRRRDSAAFSRRKSAAGVEAIRPPISGALLYFSGHF